MKTRKTNDIRVRVTDEEKIIIKEKADMNNMSLSDYMRFVAANTTIIVETKNSNE